MKILKRVGADEAEVPERASGIHLARKMANDNLRNFVELSTKFRLVETAPKEEWVGKSLKDLNLRKKFNLNVIGYHKGDNWSIQIDPEKPLERDVNLLVILDEEDVKK
jgi:trk system potassium uptake protein TrkA